MMFSVQGDCPHNEITNFSCEILSVINNNIILASPIPSDNSCPNAAIIVTGSVTPIFKFDDIEVRPDRTGPSYSHPYGYPDLAEGQYQFFYDFGGSELSVAENDGGIFSQSLFIESQESSSSSSSAAELYAFNFFELEVEQASSSSTSEFMTVAIKDTQIATQIEIASQYETPNKCYYFPSESECPEGYFENGFAEDCIEACDKICCPDPEVIATPMVCGKVYGGGGGHNSPWQFHLDPDSIRLSYKKFLTEESLEGLLPSQISNSIGSDIEEGQECCFPTTGTARRMTVIGEDYCYSPLTLNAERILDEASGEYVIQSACEGDCENVSGGFCLDDELNAYRAELQANLDAEDQRFASFSDDEIIQWFLDNNVDIFKESGIDLEREYTDEELVQIFFEIQFPSSSSSSSSYQQTIGPFAGRWNANTAYDANDVVYHDGGLYSAKTDLNVEYPIGFGPEGWITCPDNATVAEDEASCPGRSNFEPDSYTEGWSPNYSSAYDYTPLVFNANSDSISSNPDNPYNISLGKGKNYILSTTGGVNSESYFFVEVPSGKTISEVRSITFSTNAVLANVGVRSGSTWTSGSDLDDSNFGTDLDNNLLTQLMSLQPGQYCFRIQSFGVEFQYSLAITLS
jgi:hypothetical protein